MNVLFLCTGNSARSIIAESLLNALGGGRFRGFSAGSHPKGEVHPLALEVLVRNACPVEGARSKSWDEFVRPGAPPIDIAITVCDAAAGESCPAFPGRPVRAHWGMPDPAAVLPPIARQRAAFAETLDVLRRRIQALARLTSEGTDRAALEAMIRELAAR